MTSTSNPIDERALEQVAEAIGEAARQEGVSPTISTRLERMRVALMPRSTEPKGFELTGELLETARAAAREWAFEVMSMFAGSAIDPGAPETMHKAAQLVDWLGAGNGKDADTVTIDEHVTRYLAETAQAYLLVTIDGHSDDDGAVAWILAAAAGEDFPPGTEKAQALARLIVALEPHRGHVDESDVLALARRATR
jgi:hypothetical protein